MKIYIVTCVNEDGWVSIVGVYKTTEVAQRSMRMECRFSADSLKQEGYVPITKCDEFAATITWGNGHSYHYQINVEEVIV